MKKIFILGAFLVTVVCGAGCQPQTLSRVSDSSHKINLDEGLDTTSSLNDLKQRIFTEKDFTKFGLGATALREQKEFTFQVKINSEIPMYTFHTASFNSSTQGKIEIFRDRELSKPFQTISLDPNLFQSENVPLFFNVLDINFDGFSDVGVVAEGGAQWVSYHYWAFDKKSGKFITTPLTNDFKKISFGNDLIFDYDKKQIAAIGLIGAVGSYKKTYQFRNNRLFLVEEIEQYNKVKEGKLSKTNHPNLQCEIIRKIYNSGKLPQETKETSEYECKNFIN